MLNIPELEKRWLRYKIKSFLPYFATITTVGIAGGYALFFMQKPHMEHLTHTKELPSQKVLKPQVQKPTKQLPQKELQPLQKTKQERTMVSQVSQEKPKVKQEIKQETPKTLLHPSMQFLEHFKYQKEPIKKEQHTQVISHKKAKKQEIQKSVETTFIHHEKKQYISIKRRETNHDIQALIKRFKTSNSPALSLFIAKKYYELGQYKKAYNYALITNKIDPDVEDSWIIFTKSLVKMGKKHQAIKTLKKYIIYSQSNKAQILLNEIQSGKFR